MQIAFLLYDPERVPEAAVRDIAQALPRYVAKNLTVPGYKETELVPEDVEVLVTSVDRLDVNTKDLVVVIWAGAYPIRTQYLDVLRKNMADDIRRERSFSKKWTGFIWILLSPQSFEEW